MFEIVIVLIVLLVLIAIGVNAFQQHKERQEAEKRAELAKQKTVVDETEDVLMAAAQLPVSSELIKILHKRVWDALRVMYQLNPTALEIKQRVQDAESRSETPPTEPHQEVNFALPDNEKQIIVMIQGIKKLRSLLRSENSKGKVDTHLFMAEDKKLEKLQLKVNVETLMKRGKTAHASGMLGSARQYYEKAIAAISAQIQPDEYSERRRKELETVLREITETLKSANASDVARKNEEQKDDLDVLFAPKKKW